MRCKNLKISTTSWWQRLALCMRRKDADGTRLIHVASPYRLWWLQISSITPKISPGIPNVPEQQLSSLSSPPPSHPSPCLCRANSFRLLPVVANQAKKKNLVLCLLPSDISRAGEGELLPRLAPKHKEFTISNATAPAAR